MIHVKTRSISPEILGTDKQLGPVFQDEKWLEYRRKWDAYPQAGIVDKVPLQIDLFAVDVCNLRCPMCPRQNFIPGKGFMAFDLIKKVIDEAAEYGLCSFNFAGLGEPTLCPDVFKVIRYAKDKGVVDVNMHTNGTRLGHEFNRQLIDSGLDRLIISLDSANKEVYEKIRVGADFERVCAAVEDLIRQRDEKGAGRPHVKANFIEMDEADATEKNRFIAYWADKVNRIAVLRYLDCQTEERLHHKDNYQQDPSFCCPELWRRLVILSDGTAVLCPRDMKKRHVLGNIREETIVSLWTGEKMQRIREIHRRGKFCELDFCCDCPDSFDRKGKGR
jgi:radical SAM protein with 4Fe4S-binding SPASM domain